MKHVILHAKTNYVVQYERTEVVDKIFKLKPFTVKQLPTKHIIIFYPITRTNSQRLATKIADIQSHFWKLQIDMIKNGNINSIHLNSRGLHLNSKSVLQFAKNLIEGIWKL